MTNDKAPEVQQPGNISTTASSFESTCHSAYTPAGQNDYLSALSRNKSSANLNPMQLFDATASGNSPVTDEQPNWQKQASGMLAGKDTHGAPAEVWNQYEGLTMTTRPIEPQSHANELPAHNPTDENSVWNQYEGRTLTTRPFQPATHANELPADNPTAPNDVWNQYEHQSLSTRQLESGTTVQPLPLDNNTDLNTVWNQYEDRTLTTRPYRPESHGNELSTGNSISSNSVWNSYESK